MLVTSVLQGNIATPTFHFTVAEPVLEIDVNTLHWYVAVFDHRHMSNEKCKDESRRGICAKYTYAWHTVFRCNVCRVRAEAHRLRSYVLCLSTISVIR
jgi:hypothetical protein